MLGRYSFDSRCNSIRTACEGDQDQEWEVIDTRGSFVARPVVPDSIRIRDVMYPELLVTMVDSLAVEHLAVIRLKTIARDSNFQ